MDRLRLSLPENELNFSMQNMIDYATFYAAFRRISYFAQEALDAGYDGIEAWPFRIVPEFEFMFPSLMDKTTTQAIRSAHQSYRTETAGQVLKKIFKEPKETVFATQAFVALPESNYSLKYLGNLQERIGPQIPLVTYPPDTGVALDTPHLLRTLRSKLFQPTPDYFELWNVRTTEEMIQKASDIGFDGVCLGTYHLRRNPAEERTRKFDDWRVEIPKLLPHTKEIHIELGRTDFPSAPDNNAELKDVLGGTKNTDIFPIIEFIGKSGWKGKWVTEIPARAIRSELGVNRFWITPEELVSAHSRIVENIKTNLL